MFKIVQTKEKKVIVPAGWEENGQLAWPKNGADKLVFSWSWMVPNSSIGAKRASKQGNQPYRPDKDVLSSENEDNGIHKNVFFKKPSSDNYFNILHKYLKNEKRSEPSDETSFPFETMAEFNLKHNDIDENLDQHERPQTPKINSYHQTSDNNQESLQNEDDDSSEKMNFNQPNLNEDFDLKQKKHPFGTLSEYSKNIKFDFFDKNSVPHKKSNAAASPFGVNPFTYSYVSKYYKGPSKDKNYFHKPSYKEPSGDKYNDALRKAPISPAYRFSDNNQVLTRRKDFTPFGKILNFKRSLGGKENMIEVPSFVSRFFSSNRYQPASYEVPPILDEEFTIEDPNVDFTRPIAGKHNKVNGEHFLPSANPFPYHYYPSYSGVQSIIDKDEDFESPEDSNIGYAPPKRPIAGEHNKVNGEPWLPSVYSLPYHYHPPSSGVPSESEENEDFMSFEDYKSFEDYTSYEDMDLGFTPPKPPKESKYNPYNKASYGVGDISQLGKEINYNRIKTSLLSSIVGFIPHILNLAIPVLKETFLKRPEILPDPETDPMICLCTREYMPVCGSDSNTYSNYCNLNCKKSKNDPSLYMIKKGECNSNLDFDSDNSENYDDEVIKNKEDDY